MKQSDRQTAGGGLTHVGLKPFATSMGAAGWARQYTQGPVSVLLEGIRKAPKAKRFELWLQQATLDVHPESVAFDVVPVRQITGLNG